MSCCTKAYNALPFMPASYCECEVFVFKNTGSAAQSEKMIFLLQCVTMRTSLASACLLQSFADKLHATLGGTTHHIQSPISIKYKKQA